MCKRVFRLCDDDVETNHSLMKSLTETMFFSKVENDEKCTLTQ